jgi:predicted nucleic acid-binding protein
VLRATGARRARRRAFAELRGIPITEPVARVHAEVCAQRAERGEPIGAHHLWIAATPLAYGLGLATKNVAEFARVPGLRVVGVTRDVA